MLTLADFGTACFFNSLASAGNLSLANIFNFYEVPGTTKLSQSNVVQQVTMIQKNGDGAMPSGLDPTGAGFTDQYELPGYFPTSKKSGNK